MKRSREIRLVLLGSAGLVGLAGCEEAPDLTKNADLFRDELECSASRDANECARAFQQARIEHETTAPRFASQAACESKFGEANCMPAQGSQAGGQSWFLPLMMGYLMNRPAAAPAIAASTPAPASTPAAKPVYRDANNVAYSGSKAFGRFNTDILPPPRPGGTGTAVGALPSRPGAAPATEGVQRSGFGGSGQTQSIAS